MEGRWKDNRRAKEGYWKAGEKRSGGISYLLFQIRGCVVAQFCYWREICKPLWLSLSAVTQARKGVDNIKREFRSSRCTSKGLSKMEGDRS